MKTEGLKSRRYSKIPVDTRTLCHIDIMLSMKELLLECFASLKAYQTSANVESVYVAIIDPDHINFISDPLHISMLFSSSLVL